MSNSWVAVAMATVAVATAIPGNSVADNTFGGTEIVVAVLDTGVRPTHQEFSYGGPTNTTDQFVGWWDFTADKAPLHLPGVGTTWDPIVTVPYDNQGHGTGTASLAVGLNKNAVKAASYCPGCKVAIGKVLDGTGSGSIDAISAGIYWAVDNVGADVVSLSLGGAILEVVPVPGALASVDEAIQYARDAGALVVVSAGNGFLNAGVPGMPSELYTLGFSTAALVVGGATVTGNPVATGTFSWDPEVNSWGWSVRMATAASNTSYGTASGTSFSTPLVAGMAGALMATAISNSCPATPDYIERLLKFSAFDNANYPYALEGYGFLATAQFNAATASAASCSLPGRPAVDVSAIYDDAISQRVRETTSNTLDVEGTRNWALSGVAPTNGQGAIGVSTPVGAGELELWDLAVTKGDFITVTATFGVMTDANNDFDVYVYKPGSASDGLLSGTEIVKASANGAGVTETLTFRALETGTYTVAAIGWSIVADQTYSVGASSTGTTPTLSFDGEHGYAGGMAVVI